MEEIWDSEEAEETEANDVQEQAEEVETDNGEEYGGP